MHVKTLFAEIG